MGVDSDTRKEALHLYGTDSMKTHDVFAYFSDFSPASIEWISDKCCNVVWLEEESCAKALENLSVRIKGQLELEADESVYVFFLYRVYTFLKIFNSKLLTKLY